MRNRIVGKTFQAGVTLIELMVALAIASAVTAMLASLFIGQQRAMAGARDISAMQDSGRVGMELLLRDLRNTGFLIPSGKSLRIEDNCGRAGNDLAYDTSTGVWTIGTANSAMDDGHVLSAAAPAGETWTSTACPNGSDRITLVGASSLVNPSGCTLSDLGNPFCIQQNSGQTIFLACKGSPVASGNPPLATAACNATLASLGSEYGLTCANGGVNYPTPIPMTFCVDGDPDRCISPIVRRHDCVNNCNVFGAGSDKASCIDLDTDTSGTPDWAGVGGDKNKLFANGYKFRSYQILDLDGDGATELVYSDALHSLLQQAGSNVSDPRFVRVAEFVDDLQFSWHRAAGTQGDPSLFDFAGCTASAGVFDCLPTIQQAAPGAGSRLAHVRVSVLVRSRSRERGQNASSDAVSRSFRGAIENNAPAAEPFTTNAGTIAGYGCTVANYETCSGRGNAEGFKRRVFTEMVGMRNIR